MNYYFQEKFHLRWEKSETNRHFLIISIIKYHDRTQFLFVFIGIAIALVLMACQTSLLLRENIFTFITSNIEAQS